MALVKRSPKRTANCAFAIAHSRGGIFHSFSERFKTRKRSFSAFDRPSIHWIDGFSVSPSVGKWPLALTARHSLEFRTSMAFVTGMR